jgi:hypothetical protein
VKNRLYEVFGGLGRRHSILAKLIAIPQSIRWPRVKLFLVSGDYSLPLYYLYKPTIPHLFYLNLIVFRHLKRQPSNRQLRIRQLVLYLKLAATLSTAVPPPYFNPHRGRGILLGWDAMAWTSTNLLERAVLSRLGWTGTNREVAILYGRCRYQSIHYYGR